MKGLRDSLKFSKFMERQGTLFRCQGTAFGGPNGCLNENWFSNLADAREKIAEWKEDYDEKRPHSSLQHRTQWSSQRRLRSSTEMKWGEPKPEKVSLSLD